MGQGRRIQQRCIFVEFPQLIAGFRVLVDAMAFALLQLRATSRASHTCCVSLARFRLEAAAGFSLLISSLWLSAVRFFDRSVSVSRFRDLFCVSV